MPLIGALFTFLSGWAARWLGVQAVRLVLMKVVLYTLVVTIFPVVLYNLFSSMIGEFYTLYGQQVAGSYATGTPFVWQLTGCSANMANYLKIPESFSIILSALMFRLAVSMIPFIGKA